MIEQVSEILLHYTTEHSDNVFLGGFLNNIELRQTVSVDAMKTWTWMIFLLKLDYVSIIVSVTKRRETQIEVSFFHWVHFLLFEHSFDNGVTWTQWVSFVSQACWCHCVHTLEWHPYASQNMGNMAGVVAEGSKAWLCYAAVPNRTGTIPRLGGRVGDFYSLSRSQLW